jgi:hypothetical protein
VHAGQFRQRAAPVLGTGAALAAVAGLWLFDPNTHRIPLCPLHAMTGLWCPFCGSTRAAHALLHAQPALALHDNALFVAALPLLVLFWWRQRFTAARPLPGLAMWAGVVLALAFGALRNLPQGGWLAPPV